MQVNLAAGQSQVDFDTNPPLVARTNGADLAFGQSTGEPYLFSAVGPLQDGVPDPDGAACAGWARKHSAQSQPGVVSGQRWCMLTDEGRTVLVQVLGAPFGRGTIRLKVIVWDLS